VQNARHKHTRTYTHYTLAIPTQINTESRQGKFGLAVTPTLRRERQNITHGELHCFFLMFVIMFADFPFFFFPFHVRFKRYFKLSLTSKQAYDCFFTFAFVHSSTNTSLKKVFRHLYQT